MPIRESRPIFKPRRRAGALGPWMLLALLALLAAAGLYVFDKRHTAEVDALRGQVAQLRATVDTMAAKGKTMQADVAKQVTTTGAQRAAVLRAVKALQDRVEKVEAQLKAQTAAAGEARSAVDARAAAMLKDIAAIRGDVAALARRLTAVEKRLPKASP